MKNILMILPMIFVLSCAPAGKLQPGKAAPNFNLRDVYGGEHKLADYQGQVALVVFWATWCPPCMQEVPSLKRLQNKYGEQGFKVLAVSVDGRPKKVLPKFITDNNINYQVLISDSQTEKAYGNINSIPAAFLIDRAGKLSKTYLGYTVESKLARDIESVL